LVLWQFPVELALAKIARAAEHIERDDDPITELEVLHRAAQLYDLADELMAECGPDPRIGNQAVIKVQVGAADAGPEHPDDGVVGVFDGRVRHVLCADTIGSSIVHCEHIGVLRVAFASTHSTAGRSPWWLRAAR